jgi:phenylpropionate dioxygenase-like ring-hydroxylating dioxygenase large terminal subunit
MTLLADDQTVIRRLFDHIDNKTTDLSEASWREPVASYRSPERFAAELEVVLRRYPIPFCPSASLPQAGSYVARDAAQTPIVAVRGSDGEVRAFRNACRHRGTQLISGEGCEKALVCPYHGWTYGLDGALRHVPHEHGFLGLDKSTRGLVPVACVERGGVVFVSQDATQVVDAYLGTLPPLIGPEWKVLVAAEREIPTNWKIFVEGFLEGYHILSTHPETFYPLQFDNLNVIETFGRNSRIAFPYRAIHKLRDKPPAEWTVDGKLTYVYHLFPNAMVATFPANMFLVVVEPQAIDRSLLITYVMAKDGAPRPSEAPATPGRGLTLVNDGGAEDRAVAIGVQRGLASGANDFLEFGRFEGAIGHFHRNLHALLDGASAEGRR